MLSLPHCLSPTHPSLLASQGADSEYCGEAVNPSESAWRLSADASPLPLSFAHMCNRYPFSLLPPSHPPPTAEHLSFLEKLMGYGKLYNPEAAAAESKL